MHRKRYSRCENSNPGFNGFNKESGIIKDHNERLVALLVAGCIALNYPFLSLFNKTGLWFGIPVLYLYLFLFWALFIGLAASVMEKREPPVSDSTPFESGKKD
jgi:hypothetical protein